MLSLRANLDALQKKFDQLTQTVSGIKVPDVSNLATKQDVTTVVNSIPIVPPAPDLSGFATKTALATVEGKIPTIPPAQDLSSYATKTALAAVENKIPVVPDISGLASKSALSTVENKIPAAATVSPPNTDLVQQPGTSTKYAREDHTHKARVKRAMVTIGADGTAKWDFAEAFNMTPIVTHMVQETAGQNRVNVIITAVSPTSVTVYADRMRNLPALSQMPNGLLATLTQVITGVNAIATALTGLSLSGGPGSANGVKVHLYAAEPIA